jgi:hypothetical protein
VRPLHVRNAVILKSIANAGRRLLGLESGCVLVVLPSWQTFDKEAAFGSFQVRMALLPAGSFWRCIFVCKTFCSSSIVGLLQSFFHPWLSVGSLGKDMNPQDGCLAGNRHNSFGSFDANGVCPILGVRSVVDNSENSTRVSHQKELHHRRSILLLWVSICCVPRLLVFIQINQPQFDYREVSSIPGVL